MCEPVGIVVCWIDFADDCRSAGGEEFTAAGKNIYFSAFDVDFDDGYSGFTPIGPKHVQGCDCHFGGVVFGTGASSVPQPGVGSIAGDSMVEFGHAGFLAKGEFVKVPVRVSGGGVRAAEELKRGWFGLERMDVQSRRREKGERHEPNVGPDIEEGGIRCVFSPGHSVARNSPSC